MDRICPFLVLAADRRTAVDGYDPEHLCDALTPAEALDRGRQTQLCLTEAHASCERFVAARSVHLAAVGGLPRPAPDVLFQRTRQILDPEPAWRNLTPGGRSRPSSRALVVGGVAAAAALTVAVSSIAGVFGGGASPSPSPSTQSTPSPGASTSTAPVASLPPTSSSAPTVAPTARASAAPTPISYVVQAGDTLGTIAARFGTTVEAIRAANGLTSDVINVGQVLTIR
ncbi:MAG: LysM peptidoglycan-binding domain-containing protein [Chloroflexota bacterium]|nr:LysM peptidoglycan-binding domain-containing protein [Chloroflexota bacterium]